MEYFARIASTLRSLLTAEEEYQMLRLEVRNEVNVIVKLILDIILLFAPKNGNVSVDINVKDNEGNTPLMLSAAQGFVKITRILLEYGADVLARNHHNTVLHSAVRGDNDEVVKLIMDKIKETQGTLRPYIDDKDTDGNTPLMWTAQCGYVNAAWILLEYSADTEEKNSKGMTALHWAAGNNHIEVMKLLIDKGADINVKDINGLTPLDYAKEKEHLKIAGYLAFSMSEMLRKQGKYNDAWRSYQEALDILKVVSSPNHPDILITHHNMALVLANQGKHSEALEIYQKKFDIQSKGDVFGPGHPNTLMTRCNIAVALCGQSDNTEVSWIHREVFNIKNDGELGVIEKVTREYIRKAFSLGVLFIVRGTDNGRKAWTYVLVDQLKKENFLEKAKTRSMVVANYGKILFSGWGKNPPQSIKDKIDEYFLKKVPNDLFIIKEERETTNLYHYLLVEPDKRKMFLELSKTGVSLARKTKNFGKVLYTADGLEPPEIILEKTVEAYFSSGNEELEEISIPGRMPVHIAAKEGETDFIELFLDKFMNVNDADGKKWTPLHYAAWGGHLKLVQLLIHKGADIHAKEVTRGKKPIHIAAERGYMDIVDLFLESGVGIDDTDKEGRTPLYYAAWKGHLEVVKNLADRHADINAETIHGVKPVHVASLSGDSNVIEFLLDRGANVNDTNNFNWTPLHYAAESGYLEVVKFLIENGARIDTRHCNGATPLDIAKKEGHQDIVDLLDSL